MLKKVILILILAFGLLFVLIYFQSTKNSNKKGVLSGLETIEAAEVEISSKQAGRAAFPRRPVYFVGQELWAGG